MTTAVDVASFILDNYGVMSTMKLQKLTFYSQAEALSRGDIPLFNEDFQAWRGGPVCVELFNQHQGKFLIRQGELPSREGILSSQDKEIIRTVCDVLASWTGNKLSERTHQESPWKNARGSLELYMPSNAVISKNSMRDFYRLHPVVVADK